MKKEILKLLEEKLNKKFEGTTGTDLQKFLTENSLVLLTKYASENLLMSDEFSAPDKYYLSMEAKCAHLLDEGFHYEETVSMDEEVYYTVANMVTAGDDMPMVYGYLTSIEEGFSFFQMVDKVHKICKENNANALLEFEDPNGDIDLSVEFSRDEIKFNGQINIFDDSADKLLQSFMWIAYRLNNGNLDEYLSLFDLNVVEETKVNDLDKRLLKNFSYSNKEDIINQITQTPKSIENYILHKEIIQNEDVIIAFIKSNDKYVRSFLKDVHHSNGMKFFHQHFYISKSFEYLNGLPEIKEELCELIFTSEFLLKHIDVLKELSKSVLVKEMRLLEKDVTKVEELLNEYPSLIIPLTRYYEKKFDADKDYREKFLKNNKLYEKTNVFNLSVLKAIELTNKYNLDSYLYLLDMNFEYYDTVIKFCEDLPLDIKRKIISNNYYFMKYFKNDFSYDEPLVEKIIKNCPCSSLLVSDETIIRNKLEQVMNFECLDCECKK